MTNKSLVVKSIKYIASKKVFLINNTIWMSRMDIQIMFTNMGLSTKTSFMKLRGCTLAYYETTAPDNTSETKPHKVVSKVTEKEIIFNRPGLKRIDWDLEELSPALDAQFTRSSLEFEDWGDMPEMDLEE